MWRPLLPLCLVFASCATPAAEPVEPVDWCVGDTRFDPANSLPADGWSVPEDSALDEFVSVYEHLEALDGWGLTAGTILRFGGRVEPASLNDETVGFVVLPESGPAVLVRADVQLTDYDATAILRPRTPLPERTRVAAFVTREARGTDGSCVAPSSALRDDLLESPEHVAAVSALGLGPADVSAMVVFSTQSAYGLSESIAGSITAPAVDPLDCQTAPDEGWTVCDGLVNVVDYRTPDRLLADGSPQSTYDLPVTVWLPGDGSGGPFPTVFYGHGLAHDRSQGSKVSSRLTASEGVAVIAVDAVEHGEHPGRTEVSLDFLGQLTFFGIEFSPPSVDGRLIRDNFRQSTFDKLQIVEAIRAGWDVDGDGTDDLDGDRLAYSGLSLGAIMGVELLALSDAFVGAVLNVPGGRTTGIIRDSELFSPLIGVMAPEGTSDGDVQRYFPLLQAVVDPGDAMTWAPRVGDVPLLVQLAHLDETMPNSTSDPLVRSLGLSGVGREVWPIADVDFVAGPVTGRGLQQFDAVTDGGDAEAATHDNLFTSDEAWGAARSFLLEVLAGGAGTISDPYGG